MLLTLRTPLLLLLSYWLCMAACSNPQSPSEAEQAAGTQRLVSLSGAITESLFALGKGEQVVGVDVTSTYPAEVRERSQVGHIQNLNVEGVLGLQPDVILVEAKDSATAALKTLREAGLDVFIVPNEATLEGPKRMLKALAAKVGADEALAPLLASYEAQEAELAKTLERIDTSPSVLFIYARGKGNMMVAGQGTPAQAMIELAGGKNAVTQFEGFQALSAEGLMAAQPDVLLMFETGLKSLGGEAQVLNMPGVAQTPAGKNQRILAMDGLYLLGFTPRAPQAAAELATALQQIAQQTADPSLISVHP